MLKSSLSGEHSSKMLTKLLNLRVLFETTWLGESLGDGSDKLASLRSSL
ncbi:MAG: hypothetical protein QXP68_06495 [Thermosphaera sp.]